MAAPCFSSAFKKTATLGAVGGNTCYSLIKVCIVITEKH